MKTTTLQFIIITMVTLLFAVLFRVSVVTKFENSKLKEEIVLLENITKNCETRYESVRHDYNELLRDEM